MYFKIFYYFVIVDVIDDCLLFLWGFKLFIIVYK